MKNTVKSKSYPSHICCKSPPFVPDLIFPDELNDSCRAALLQQTTWQSKVTKLSFGCHQLTHHHTCLMSTIPSGDVLQTHPTNFTPFQSQSSLDLLIPLQATLSKMEVCPQTLAPLPSNDAIIAPFQGVKETMITKRVLLRHASSLWIYAAHQSLLGILSARLAR